VDHFRKCCSALTQQTLLEVRAGEKKDGHLAKLPLLEECVGLTSNLGDRSAPLLFLFRSQHLRTQLRAPTLEKEPAASDGWNFFSPRLFVMCS
jgi:hypothetical protein